MNLEVGMYLRHSGLDGEYPIIQKITELKTPGRCGGKYKVFTDKCGDWFIDSDYIEINNSKYSFEIKELLKTGDIVIGLDGHKFEVYAIGNDCVYINLQEFIMFKDIKSIVTKEAIKSNAYEIGGKNERRI